MLPLNHPRLIPEDDRLEHARVCSPFLAGLIDRHPDWLAGLNREGRLDHGPGPSKETLEQMIGDHNLDAGLRQFRNREMLRIVWRDLSGLARLEETMADLTGLAETCLDTALAHHSLRPWRITASHCVKNTVRHATPMGWSRNWS
jgi:glutamate-ammonia-ligase adenylyltransferase